MNISPDSIPDPESPASGAVQVSETSSVKSARDPSARELPKKQRKRRADSGKQAKNLSVPQELLAAKTARSPRRAKKRNPDSTEAHGGEVQVNSSATPGNQPPAILVDENLQLESTRQGQEKSPTSNMDETRADELADTQNPRKGRRGKRGGKRNSHRQVPQADHENAGQESAGYLSVEELCKIPALPPATEVLEELSAICVGELEKGAQKPRKSSVRQSVKNAATKRRMFISVIPGEQVEVGLAEDGVLLEYYLDMLHHSKLKGNIYKGVIHNIDTNLQAAFVDFGVGKNGFLQIDEVHPEYWQGLGEDSGDKKKLPPIQKVLKPGQELLVQVVKEPAGNKGAFLTTWLSLAGRFLVLTPGQEQVGVSRKVADPEERARLREMMNGISPGAGLGVIVRTVGEGATKTTLKTDLQYLKRLWREIRKKATEVKAPALVHQEPGLSERSVRDYLTDDVTEIWVDDADEATSVKAMAGLLFPRKKNLVHIYQDTGQSLWDHFNLSQQLEQIYAREVGLPSGGRLVFDQTEALMAIDINSGRISGKGNFEAMAFKTNMEASVAIARQLRLRDIGGQVVIDFIEMREKKHVQEVEKALRQAMKSDRARHDVAHISAFGLLELVRQRMGSSALSLSMETCTACGGTGLRRNLEWQSLRCLRELSQRLKNAAGEKYACEYPRDLGLYLLNYKREALRKLEADFGKTLEIRIQL